MTPEEFEKYFEILKDVFEVMGDDHFFVIEKEDDRKKVVKEILEEIYNKGYSDGFGYLIDGKEDKQ